jgi:hypothetical protein
MLDIEVKPNFKSNASTVMANTAKLNGRRISFGYPHDVPVAAPTQRGSGHKPYRDIEEVRRVMNWQEKGTKNIFPRPFFAPLMQKKHEEIMGRAQTLARNVLYKSNDVYQELSNFGFYLVNKVQKQIRDRKAPLLKPATVKRKRSKLLLRDTWAAYNSIAFKLYGDKIRQSDITRKIAVIGN